MSSLIRWEPAREMMTLREAMDHLFDDAFTRPLRLGNGHWSMPTVDMYQTDNEIVVKAAIPGVKADDVQINVTGEVLTIKGEKRSEREEKEANYHVVERNYGSFSRSLKLPAAVELDKIEAKYDKGVLTVTCPKKEEVKPKAIEIKTA